MKAAAMEAAQARSHEASQGEGNQVPAHRAFLLGPSARSGSSGTQGLGNPTSGHVQSTHQPGELRSSLRAKPLVWEGNSTNDQNVGSNPQPGVKASLLLPGPQGFQGLSWPWSCTKASLRGLRKGEDRKGKGMPPWGVCTM